LHHPVKQSHRVELKQPNGNHSMKANRMAKIIRLIPAHAVILILIAWPRDAARAQDYLGASNVLYQVAQRSATPAAKQPKDATAQLKDDLKSFRESVTNLAPADAAAHWLELVDRAAKLQQQTQNYNSSSTPVQADDILGAMPPPDAWSSLAKSVAGRAPAKSGEEVREAGLRLLAATLTGDIAGRDREIDYLQSKALTANQLQGYFYNSLLQQLEQTTLSMSDNPNDILKSLGYQLAYGNGQGQQLQVPNLVSLIGEEKTRDFLQKALVAPNVTLQFNTPNATSRLAQKLALELMDQLKTPQWGLVNSLDAVELYEALDKRFGVTTNSLASLVGLTNVISAPTPGNFMGDFQKQSAGVYYMLGLISRDRTADAVAIAKSLTGQNNDYIFEEAFKAMENAGFTTALDNFFNQLLSQNPALPFWDQYVEVAADAGQTDRMLALVRANASRDDLSENQKAALHLILFKALLAADDVDGGIQQARQLVGMDVNSPLNNGYKAGQLGVMMAQIGLLLHRPELVAEGTATARKWLASPAGQNFANGDTAAVVCSLAKVLFEAKRGPEAESILTDALANATRPGNTPTDFGWNPGGPSRQILTALAKIYYQAGRYDDVLTLLKQSPDWNAKDLSELFNMSSFENDVSVMELHKEGAPPLPVPFLAAYSLAATGNKLAARKIDDAVLDRFPGLDRGYELLLALNGTNAIPRLDELFARDQFEERPLIWKAHLLRQENQLAQAEKTIRQAIAIDPSDGEEGRGDRMRAYAELADILVARGDLKGAEDYQNIVKAIRLSEDADQFFTAGLLKRAIAMYEQSLNYFSDAYCIQSRLAVQLAALGKTAEAEQHYRRAYELMPDSFGRVESHCFGCERVFDGERAQNMAEKVFSQLAVERPDKPQVHYLLGYLHVQEERYNEAMTNLLVAVHLDPDYLNAWVKMQEASDQTLMSPQQRDNIAFDILRLDPLQRHAQVDFQRVSDLKGLWIAVAGAAGHQPERSTTLFTLDASQIAMEKKGAQPASSRQMMDVEYPQMIQAESENLSPAAAVAQTQFIRTAGAMIMNNSDSTGE
jgi:tetratricopeptide (TPR) repeat protein